MDLDVSVLCFESDINYHCFTSNVTQFTLSKVKVHKKELICPEFTIVNLYDLCSDVHIYIAGINLVVYWDGGDKGADNFVWSRGCIRQMSILPWSTDQVCSYGVYFLAELVTSQWVYDNLRCSWRQLQELFNHLEVVFRKSSILPVLNGLHDMKNTIGHIRQNNISNVYCNSIKIF